MLSELTSDLVAPDHRDVIHFFPEMLIFNIALALLKRFAKNEQLGEAFWHEFNLIMSVTIICRVHMQMGAQRGQARVLVSRLVIDAQ